MSQLVIHPAEQTPDTTGRSYTPIVTGVIVTVIMLHMVVTRPLLKRIDSLSREVASMQVELDTVAGSTTDAWQTNDLLTALTIQSERLNKAGQAIEQFDALAVRLDDLNDRVVALSTVTDNAFAVVDEFDTLHDRLAGAAGDAEAVRQDLADIREVSEKVDALAALSPVQCDALDVLTLQTGEMVDVATRLNEKAAAVSSANDTLGETTDALITIAERVDADGTPLLVEANTVLNGLQRATGDLETQGDRLASLIESAEVLEDFETELACHIRGLEDIRRELIEFAMMETTLTRLASTLEPLTEIVRLRRLQPQDLQLIVDGLRERRLENYDGPATRPAIQTAVDRPVPEPTPVLR